MKKTVFKESFVKYDKPVEKKVIKEAKENNYTRLEILLSNAIDLLLNRGYSYDEVKRELGLSEEEKQLYIIDIYGAEEVEESCKVKEEKKEKSYAEKVKEAIKVFNEMEVSVFYPALVIYEWSSVRKPDEELCRKVSKFIDGVDTIYDEYIRGEVQDIIDGNEDDDFDEDEYADDMEDSFWQDKIDGKVKEIETDEIEEDVKTLGIKLSKPKHNIAKKFK